MVTIVLILLFLPTLLYSGEPEKSFNRYEKFYPVLSTPAYIYPRLIEELSREIRERGIDLRNPDAGKHLLTKMLVSKDTPLFLPRDVMPRYSKGGETLRFTTTVHQPILPRFVVIQESPEVLISEKLLEQLEKDLSEKDFIDFARLVGKKLDEKKKIAAIKLLEETFKLWTYQSTDFNDEERDFLYRYCTAVVEHLFADQKKWRTIGNSLMKPFHTCVEIFLRSLLAECGINLPDKKEVRFTKDLKKDDSETEKTIPCEAEEEEKSETEGPCSVA